MLVDHLHPSAYCQKKESSCTSCRKNLLVVVDLGLLELVGKEVRWENGKALFIHFYCVWHIHTRKDANSRHLCG